MDILGFIVDAVVSAFEWLHDTLDFCPFPDIISGLGADGGMSLGFAWLNWFIPVGGILGMLTGWLAALALYYGISIILRWIKAIQ